MISQVTGLPRSGTGFITVFLNLHPSCVAHHDIASETDDWRGYSERMEETVEHVIEVSTYGWLPKAHRPGRKVFIDRDPVEIVQSMNDTLGIPHNVGQYHMLRRTALQWAKDNDALIIPFEALFTDELLEVIWGHLFGNYRFPVEKARILLNMNIQRHHPELMLGSAETARQRLFE